MNAGYFSLTFGLQVQMGLGVNGRMSRFGKSFCSGVTRKKYTRCVLRKNKRRLQPQTAVTRIDYGVATDCWHLSFRQIIMPVAVLAQPICVGQSDQYITRCDTKGTPKYTSIRQEFSGEPGWWGLHSRAQSLRAAHSFSLPVATGVQRLDADIAIGDLHCVAWSRDARRC